MYVEFQGELTGGRFGWDDSRPLIVPGWGTRYRGVVADPSSAPAAEGQAVLVHTIDTLNSSFQADFDRACRAIELARRPAVVACPTIVRLIDFNRTEFPADRFGSTWENLRSAWEYGELWLRDVIRHADDRERLAHEVDAGIRPALACLHGDGLVHSDVAPNNIVRVGGAWKLMDLDHCVEEGGPTTGMASAPYAMPGTNVGDPADRAMDTYGLEAVLAEIRVGAGLRPG